MRNVTPCVATIVFPLKLVDIIALTVCSRFPLRAFGQKEIGEHPRRLVYSLLNMTADVLEIVFSALIAATHSLWYRQTLLKILYYDLHLLRLVPWANHLSYYIAITAGGIQRRLEPPLRNQLA